MRKVVLTLVIFVVMGLFFANCAKRSEEAAQRTALPWNGQVVGNGDNLDHEIFEEARTVDLLLTERIRVALSELKITGLTSATAKRLAKPFFDPKFLWDRFVQALNKIPSGAWPSGCSPNDCGCTIAGDSEFTYISLQNCGSDISFVRAKHVWVHEAFHEVYPEKSEEEVLELTQGFFELAKHVGDVSHPQWLPMSSYPNTYFENPRAAVLRHSLVSWTGNRLIVWDPEASSILRFYDPFKDHWITVPAPQMTEAVPDESAMRPMVGAWTQEKLAVLTQPWLPTSDRLGMVVYDPASEVLSSLDMSLFASWELPQIQLIPAGNALVVWSTQGKHGRFFYASTLSWKHIPPLPFESNDILKAIWVQGQLMLFWNRFESGTWRVTGAAYDPYLEYWTKLHPPPSDIPAVNLSSAIISSTGNKVVFYGETFDAPAPAIGIIYDPEPNSESWELMKPGGPVQDPRGLPFTGGVTKTKFVVRGKDTRIYDLLSTENNWNVPRVIDPPSVLPKVFWTGVEFIFFNPREGEGAVFRF